MLKISKFAVENLTEGCVTDAAAPAFSFAPESDRENASLKKATLTLGDWRQETASQIAVPYTGEALKPFTAYEAALTAEDDAGETARASIKFETGRLGTPWAAKWISDPGYTFTEKGVSPVPMTFRREVRAAKKVCCALINSTAMGVYELYINGRRVGDRYFAPGFTSYKTNLMYQTYDVTDMLTGSDTLDAVVAGGWAVETPYGVAASRWKIEDGVFTLNVTVPVSTKCSVVLPNGDEKTVGSGMYTFTAEI